MCAVTILNRLEGDQVPKDTALLKEFSERPIRLLCGFLKEKLTKQESTLNGLLALPKSPLSKEYKP